MFKTRISPQTTRLGKDENGSLIADDSEIKGRWDAYFRDFLNPVQGQRRPEPAAILDVTPMAAPTLDDVDDAIKYLKISKAQGIGGISAELIKTVVSLLEKPCTRSSKTSGNKNKAEVVPIYREKIEWRAKTTQ